MSKTFKVYVTDITPPALELSKTWSKWSKKSHLESKIFYEFTVTEVNSKEEAKEEIKSFPWFNELLTIAKVVEVVDE